ncbi:MAG: NAD(P)-dependent oxidoreductase [Caldilineae bacterium]|nr:MAG: NAD(P)-dependent oxidoreductase [Caldilineae bacterium]
MITIIVRGARKGYTRLETPLPSTHSTLRLSLPMNITGSRPIDRKERLLIPREPVPKQSPEERVHNFHEVYLGYDEESVVVEATRCLQCPAPQPCTLACPMHNDIPRALWHVSQGEFFEAYQVFRETSTLSEVCGRVCPQERLCQGSCVVGAHGGDPVYIGKIEAFVADYARKNGLLRLEPAARTGRTVAIVGSGPAGLHAAEVLALRGHSVDVYEAWPKPGGLLYYGIPCFKLEKDKVVALVERIEKLGVRFICNTRINAPGQPSVDDLLAQYDAVLLAIGSGVPATMGIEGEDLPGVWKSIDFLVATNLPKSDLPPGMPVPEVKGKHVVVVGGGDTGSDCVRSAVRCGAASVTLSYRRTEAEMPGRAEDRQFAREEGIKYEFLTQPVRFIPGEDGHVAQIEMRRMKLGEPDASGRRRPVPIEGSEFIINADLVVLALGFWPDDRFVKGVPDLETKKWGEIIVDPDTGKTSRVGLWAAGDAVNGADLVVTAMAGARRAALNIDAYLKVLTEVYRAMGIEGSTSDEKAPVAA